MKKLSVVKRFIKSQLLFKKEEQEADTYAEILEGTRFHGYNLWILGFAMIIACVGLNTDSISAVIGAMLISPLMGPIVGFAFALAINDNSLKKQGIRNWFWMTFISLLASVLFFLISPFDNNTNALAGFKRASIFDILLAFFWRYGWLYWYSKKRRHKGYCRCSRCNSMYAPSLYGWFWHCPC